MYKLQANPIELRTLIFIYLNLNLEILKTFSFWINHALLLLLLDARILFILTFSVPQLFA